MDQPIAFEIRSIAPFNVASQTYTLPASHEGIDPETGKRTSGVSVWTKDRTLRTYVTDRKDDREAYIKSDPMDITISPRFPHFRVMRDEWSEKEMKQFRMFFTTHPNVCDYNNPAEFDKVTKTPIGKKANAKFLFEEKSATVKTRIEEIEETNLITSLLMSNKTKEDVLRAYLYYLGENPSEAMTAGEMYLSLMETCQPIDGKHRENFLKTYVRQGANKEDIERTIIANRAISTGDITLVNGIYSYGTEKIGQSIDQVVLWLKGNKSAMTALARNLGMSDDADLRRIADEQRKEAEAVHERLVEKQAAERSQKEQPYGKDQLDALRGLFLAVGVKKPHLIGNTGASDVNECTLTTLLASLNDKLERQHGFTLTAEDVDELVQLSASIRIDVDEAKLVVEKRTQKS